MPPSPEHLPAIENSCSSPDIPSRQRIGRRCLAPGCNTLVIFGRLCDACIMQTAIELAQRFERELIERGLEPGSGELRAALAGTGSRSLLWYENDTQLGHIAYQDAVILRTRTETACFLVALGGVKALAHLPGHPNFRDALASYAGVEDLDRADETPQPGVVARIAADDAEPGERMGRLFGSLPRIQTTVLEKPEQRFDAYTLAVMAIVALFLLIHR